MVRSCCNAARLPMYHYLSTIYHTTQLNAMYCISQVKINLTLLQYQQHFEAICVGKHNENAGKTCYISYQVYFIQSTICLPYRLVTILHYSTVHKLYIQWELCSNALDNQQSDH